MQQNLNQGGGFKADPMMSTLQKSLIAETISGDEGSGARDGRDVGVGEGTRGDDAFDGDPRVAPLGAR